MNESELDQLFSRYRDACGSPEPGKNFMPHLWQSIEARQSKGAFFARAAKSMAAAAAALSLALALFLAISSQSPSAFFSSSYVEAIETDQAAEFGTFAPPVRLELTSMEIRHR